MLMRKDTKYERENFGSKHCCDNLLSSEEAREGKIVRN